MSPLDKIRETLTSSEFWQGTAAAVILSLLGLVGKSIWGMFVRLVQAKKDFDITGYWIGRCDLPSYDSTQLEIWRYVRTGDKVDLSFFAYSPSRPTTKWLGGGVFRGKMLTAYYYLYEKDTYESGAVVLSIRALDLEGMYAQFDPKHPEEPLYASNINTDSYVQYRVRELPRFARLRMALGRAPLRSHRDVLALFETVKRTRKPSKKLPPMTISGAPAQPRAEGATSEHA